MMRRVGHSAPLSIAVVTSMLACAAVAQEPQKPLPFELFHGTTTIPGTGKEAQNPETPSTDQAGAEAALPADQASSDGLQPAAVEGVQAPYSEPTEESGFEIGEKMEVLEPYKLVRSLQFVQDAVVKGDHSAM